MTPLVDADILRYEIGFASETGWKEITKDPDRLPPFDYVADMLHGRLDSICYNVKATKSPILFITEGETFRYKLATIQPYKGTRVPHKPWHYNNLTVYMKAVLDAEVVTGIEADDAIAIRHTNSNLDTIICTRDKDLRQVYGWFYSWELGNQPSFGPALVDLDGWLELSEDRKKLNGCGLSFFYAQMLMGDRTDNIPGLNKWGPVKVAGYLEQARDTHEMLKLVQEAYENEFGDEWHDRMLEVGRLLWITRRLKEDGSPELWSIGQRI